MKNEDWGRAGAGLVSDRWPKDENGRAEESVFLCTCGNTDLSDELTVNMLEAYGIPCVRDYPGDGAFGRVIMGASGTGVDIYVPKSMLELAQKLIEEVKDDEEL
ncbi:MAG: hypothetical protein IKD61_07950 [Oscillospiraceae bacterium]|nr:hypothetical protein [Oscillospiraceae bacterium]